MPPYNSMATGAVKTRLIFTPGSPIAFVLDGPFFLFLFLLFRTSRIVFKYIRRRTRRAHPAQRYNECLMVIATRHLLEWWDKTSAWVLTLSEQDSLDSAGYGRKEEVDSLPRGTVLWPMICGLLYRLLIISAFTYNATMVFGLLIAIHRFNVRAHLGPICRHLFDKLLSFLLLSSLLTILLFIIFSQSPITIICRDSC